MADKGLRILPKATMVFRGLDDTTSLALFRTAVSQNSTRNLAKTIHGIHSAGRGWTSEPGAKQETAYLGVEDHYGERTKRPPFFGSDGHFRSYMVLTALKWSAIGAAIATVVTLVLELAIR